jgi:hypothetical protein
MPRPYQDTIAKWWQQPGNVPPYRWTVYGDTTQRDRPLRPSPGDYSQTMLGFRDLLGGAGGMVNQAQIAITFLNSLPLVIEFTLDAGAQSGTADIYVDILTGDTAVQIRDKFVTQVNADPAWPAVDLVAVDIVAGDWYSGSDWYRGPGPHAILIDPNKGNLEGTTGNGHVSATGGTGVDGFLMYLGEYPRPAFPARWGFNRAELPGNLIVPE